MSDEDTREDGFTLIELLLSVAIIVVIVASIAMSMIVFLTTAGEASRRNDHSASAGLVTTYLDRDAASATELASRHCPLPASVAAAGAVAAVGTFRWADFEATGAVPTPRESATSYFASYYTLADESVVGDARPRRRVVRQHCTGPTPSGTPLTAANTSPLSTDVLGHGLLASPSPLTFTATAADALCPANGASVRVALVQYQDDAVAPFTFRACLKSRLI